MNSQPAASGSSSSGLSEPPSPAKLERRSRHLEQQVQAFLEAADDVELDPSVLQDIISGFADDYTLFVEGDEAHGPLVATEAPEPSDIPALRELQKEDIPMAWSDQQIAGMMRHLKEHGMNSFVAEYFLKRGIPILRLLYAFGVVLCSELRDKQPPTLLYFLKVAMSRELRLREKLPQHNTIEDAVELISRSQRILVLSGAGISTSCGIPDFRSRDGLYASLAKNGAYQLEDPHQMFDIQFFRTNPSVFYKIYPSNFIPSPCHRFIKLVEEKGKLLRNYTQNIDTLETQTGVRKVLQCHGSFATATCVQCAHKVAGSEIEADIMKQKVPLCMLCNPPVAPTPKKRKFKKMKTKGKNGWVSDESDSEEESEHPPGIMKPDITFFGEKLTDEFDRALEADRTEVDLLIVIGTSLKVAPVSNILSHLPHSIPQILINKTPVKHINPDVVLLGNADDIVQHLCEQLDWTLPPLAPTDPAPDPALRVSRAQTTRKRTSEGGRTKEPKRLGSSHVWLFEGAEVGEWGEQFEDEEDEDEEGDEAGSETEEKDEEKPAEVPIAREPPTKRMKMN